MNATTPINATPTNRINGMGNSPIVESDFVRGLYFMFACLIPLLQADLGVT